MALKNQKYASAAKLYEQGLSIQEIADSFGVTRQAMWKILKRRNVKFRPNLRYKSENHFYRGKTKANDYAQNALEYALRKGIVEKKTHCEECGSTGLFKDGRSAIQAHHDNYNEPLKVRWLCQKCHHLWHKTHKAIFPK